MPFAPFTCWSTGVATDCSTVRASAPVYVAVVWIWGGAISGNCAIGSRKIMTAPAIIVRIARTCATIGCSMKNLDTGVLSPHRGRRGWGCGGRVRFRTDGDTVLHLLQSLRNDAFAWLEPLVDDPEPVHLLARLHGAERDLVVRSDDGDLVHALGLLHRTLRYDEGTMERLRGGAYLGVEAGAKDGVGIREEGLHQARPRLLIDLAVRDVEPAGMGIRAGVGEDQLEIGLVPCPALLLVLTAPIRIAKVFALGDREGPLHRIHLGDVREHGRRSHEIADLDGRDSGDPLDRRVDLGPCEVEARVLDGRLGALHLSLARVRRLDGVVEFLLGRRTLRRERLVLREVARAIVALTFGYLDCDQMTASHLLRNPASGRVMEKCGLTLVQRVTRAHRGKQEPFCIRGITRDAWERWSASGDR